MATLKPTINLRLRTDTFTELHRLHAGYGEAQRVVQQLVEAYVTARKTTKTQVEALTEAVLSRVR